MNSNNKQLVCFDLGGVLVRICRGWTEAAKTAGVTGLPEDGETWSRHHALMLRYETGELDEAGYEKELPHCLRGVPAESVLRVFDAWLLGLYPDVANFLAELKGAGLATACLSNTNARHWRALLRRDSEYAPLSTLDHHFLSYELGVMKPHERAYRRVEQLSGAPARDIFFFDDKPENVDAARKLGWNAELIDPQQPTVPQMRDALVRHGVLDAGPR